jgi:prevent-host-death family protein
MRAADFKARCLQAMDAVAATGEVIVITKRGRPVAQLAPVATKPRTLRGFLKGSIRSGRNVIRPVGVRWNADDG